MANIRSPIVHHPFLECVCQSTGASNTLANSQTPVTRGTAVPGLSSRDPQTGGCAAAVVPLPAFIGSTPCHQVGRRVLLRPNTSAKCEIRISVVAKCRVEAKNRACFSAKFPEPPAVGIGRDDAGLSGILCNCIWLVETQAVAVGHGQDVEDGLPAVDLAGGVGPVLLSLSHAEV